MWLFYKICVGVEKEGIQRILYTDFVELCTYTVIMN